MRSVIALILYSFCNVADAKVAVFWQNGFPTVSGQPISRQALGRAFKGEEPEFLDLRGLEGANTLAEADLLVMPYGSAFPVEAWTNIHGYLKRGGNLLVIGGQPFRVPVSAVKAISWKANRRTRTLVNSVSCTPMRRLKKTAEPSSGSRDIAFCLPLS